MFEGICAAPPNGFEVDDALALYGGLSVAKVACRDCPANALQVENANSLASCFGMVPLPPSERDVHAAVEEAIERLKVAYGSGDEQSDPQTLRLPPEQAAD